MHFFKWLLLTLTLSMPVITMADINISSKTSECQQLLDSSGITFNISPKQVTGNIITCDQQQLVINFGTQKQEQRLTISGVFATTLEPKEFYGLASYYNNVLQLWLDNQQSVEFTNLDNPVFSDNNWLAIIGRFQAALINAPQAKTSIANQQILLDWQPNTQIIVTLAIGDKDTLTQLNPLFIQIHYASLWSSLSYIAKSIESLLVQIQKHITANWGIAIIILALILKLLLLPLGFLTIRLQNTVAKQQSVLLPQIQKIKQDYKGEKAHHMIMQAYKNSGISYFYQLKPFTSIFIQLPILIAIFNVLGEMAQLNNSSFLWINNLAYPDSLMKLPFSIPWLGNSINLLPIIMTLITILTSILFNNIHAPIALVKQQKLQLYFMAVAFLILFYPFPAAMVLYWTTTNILYALQQFINTVILKN